MRNTFKLGTTVKVGFFDNIPVRYQGRNAIVVGRSKIGRGFRYLVEFNNRRVKPLPVSSSQITLVA